MATMPRTDPSGDGPAVPVTRTDGDTLDDESFRRLDDALGSLPWAPFRIDFGSVGAHRHPWPTDDSADAFLDSTWITAFEDVVVLLALARPDQPRGRVVAGRELLEAVEAWEISDAIVLPLVGPDDEVLLTPAMWIEVGSNIWIWGDDESSGRQ